MIDGLETLLHQPVDLTSLALFRALFGLLLVANAISYRRSPELLAPDGLLPDGTWRRGPQRSYVSLLRWLPPTSRSVSLVIWLYGLAGLALSLGLATRWAAALAFVAGVSLHHRNRHALHSGDALARVLGFLLIVSDAGAVWSLDAIRTPHEPAGSPWALRLMQLQVAAVYLHSVRFKLAGKTWRAGTATHYASRLLTHRKRRVPAALDGAGAHRVATWGTLGAELAGGTLVWLSPVWFLGVGALAWLHLTLQWFMRMHLFQWTMLVSLILWIPGDLVADLLRL